MLDVVLPSRSCYTAGDEDAVTFAGTDALRRAGLRCVALVPIRPALGSPALLAVVSPRRRKLDTQLLELLELLAAQAANRLETLGHMVELHRRATEDSLTGIGNRAAFSDELDRWERTGASGAIALIDVDDFKQVNDTFGHLEGDRLLTELAALLRSAVRPADGVYRIGGDEFAVLLEGTTEGEARKVIERVERKTASALSPRGAGMSVGVAQVPAGQPVDFALREADQRLYRTKRDRKKLAPRLL
jgi:diguanylate cyclase (GGDEF)-like protein